MTLGERILKYRKKAGISQEELADKLNVTRQSISLWETDQTLPSLDNLIALADIFGISMDELCGREIQNDVTEQTPLDETTINAVNDTPSQKQQIKIATPNRLLKISFLLSILSLFLGLLVVMVVFLASPLPEFVESLSRYVWIFFLFIPLPLASIILGIIFLQKKYKCKKNIVVGVIICVVLCLLGQFTFSLKPLAFKDDPYLLYLENSLPIKILDKSDYMLCSVSNKESGMMRKAMIKCKDREYMQHYIHENEECFATSLSANFNTIMQKRDSKRLLECNYFYFYNYTYSKNNYVSTEEENHYVLLGYNAKNNTICVFEFLYRSFDNATALLF